MSVKLVSNDGVTLSLPLAAAQLSEYIKGTLPSDGSAPTDDIPVPAVNGEILGWAVEFLNLRTTKPMYPGAKTKRPLMDKDDIVADGVDADFAAWINAKADLDIMKIFNFLEAADFLGNEDMTDLAAMRIAVKYLSWDYHQRNGIFEVPDELPAGEEEELKKEFDWAMEEPDLVEDIKREQEAIAAAAAAGDRA